jgi:hypothetical protein
VAVLRTPGGEDGRGQAPDAVAETRADLIVGPSKALAGLARLAEDERGVSQFRAG